MLTRVFLYSIGVADKNMGGDITQRKAKKMNFEVLCFDYINDGAVCVQKEYFDTYYEARQFEDGEGKQYAWVSITPLNYEAEREMACCQCGDGTNCEYCHYSK